MRIEWIEVENFKGFDKRRFEFDEHFTLFVGENGSGKTSLVEAVGVVIGGAVSGMYSSGVGEDFTRLMRTAGRMAGASVIIEPQGPLMLDTSVVLNGQIFEFRLLCRSGDSNAMQAAMHQFRQTWSSATPSVFDAKALLGAVLPLFVCYPAARAFSGQLQPDFNKIMAAKPSRHDGYVGWNAAYQNAKSFTEWLARYEAIGREDGADSALFNSTKAAILDACPGMKNIRFSVKQGEPVVEWENGDIVGFSLLSDGQKSILTMVADIARRAAMLNPDLENPVAETPGVVVIDEIDLHLHPRWQRRIMADLRRVFPKIQFIATTHSPIIISAAKDARVVRLEAGGSTVLGQAYGLDVNWVVDELQGGDSQSPEVKELVMKADELIDEGQMDEAQKIVEQLRDIQQGGSTDTVRLEATINNIIALAHAED